MQLRLTYLWNDRGVIAEAMDGNASTAMVHLPCTEYRSPSPSYSMRVIKQKLVESIGDPVKRFVVERGLHK